MKLTPKQKRFVEEYLIDLNATQAAIRAGYSEKVAKEIGYENLTKPHIRDLVDQAIEERSKRTGITVDRVLEEYAKIGFADIKDYLAFRTEKVITERDRRGEPITEYATIVELKDSSLVDGAVISEVSLKDGTLKFKLHDKKGALDSVARHLGMFNDKIEHSGEVTTINIMPASKRTGKNG